MKKSLLLLILSTFALSGCSIEVAKNNQNEGENTDIPTPIPTGDEEEKTYTVSIPMCGEVFAEYFAVHQDLLSSDQSDFIQAYINSFLDGKDYIIDINYWCLNTNDYNNVRYLTIGTGYFLKAGKYNSGALEVYSSKEILKVEVTAKAYMNAYPGYGDKEGLMIYQPDYVAGIKLDDQELSLAVQEDAIETVSKTISVDYSASGGTKNFKIESKDARVFVEEIKITWKGENS